VKILITLPLPLAELSPNARVFWAKKAKITKAYREYTWAETKKRLGRSDPPRWAEATVQATFYYPTAHKHDRDNALASLKAAFDGIADAGVVENDAGLIHLPVKMEIDRDRPRLELVIEGKDDTDPDKTPCHASCKNGHRWVVAMLPMPVSKFATAAESAHCPECGEKAKHIFETT